MNINRYFNQKNINIFQKLFKNFFCLIMLFILNGCATIEDTISPPDSLPNFENTPSNMVGYGVVNTWIQLSKKDWEEMADSMVKAGLNVTQVELLSFGKDGYYDNPDKAIDKFVEFARVFHRRKITIFVTIVNWNFSDGQGGGDKTICNSKYNLEWFAHIVNRIKNEIGTEGIILEPASEWCPSCRNSACYRKAQEFHNWVNNNWPGLKAWNYGCRPTSAPNGYILDFHVASANNLGNKYTSKIIITDTSSILNYLGGLYNYASNHDRLASLVKASKNKGAGFILYHYSPPSIDYAAIEVIGQSWK